MFGKQCPDYIQPSKKVQQLEAENTALKAELIEEKAAHFKTHNWLIDRNEELAAAESLRAKQLEFYVSAVVDANRYRWLTDGIDHEIDIASWDGEQWCCNYMDKVAIDAAIDDAIAKEKTE